MSMFNPDVFAVLRSIHDVLSVRLSEVREYPATADGRSAFAARDFIVLSREHDGSVTEYRLPLFASGIDGAAALALSGPELESLCPAPERLTAVYPDGTLAERYPPLPSANGTNPPAPAGWDFAPGR